MLFLVLIGFCHKKDGNFDCAVILNYGFSLLCWILIFKMNDLELSILRFLWAEGPSYSQEIHKGMSKINIAYSTLSLSLRMLEIKGIIGHERLGQRYRYFTVLEMETFISGRIENLVHDYFQGNRKNMGRFLTENGFL
jgi:predicted transcriptional regulator